MRNWIRTHVLLALVVLAAASGAVTILSWAIPGARKWMLAHPGIGWSAAFIALFALACILIINDRLNGTIDEGTRTANDITASRDALTNDLAAARAAVAAAHKERGNAHATIRRLETERDTLKRQRDDAQAALHPTQRDVEQFSELLQIWDPLGNLMTWLSTAFNARQWTSEDSEPLYTFVAKWEHRFFDEPTFNTVYREFLTNARSLTSWMSRNAGWDRELNKGRQNDDPVIYSVADGDERQGGWGAFDALREEALEYAAALLDSREGLERVGRSRGL